MTGIGRVEAATIFTAAKRSAGGQEDRPGMMPERMKAYRSHSPEARPMCCRGETLLLLLARQLPLDQAGCERMPKPNGRHRPAPKA